MKTHRYSVTVEWTGNRGSGTSGYTAYSRDHEISAEHKQIRLPGSSDAAFRGDPSRYSPEELLVAALAACHMLWVLHLCAVRKVIVTQYHDSPAGEMAEENDGSGRFTRVTLRPKMRITSEDQIANALEAHRLAHHMCFIANSMNFEIAVEPEITT